MLLLNISDTPATSQVGSSLEFIPAIADRQCYIQDASGRGLCSVHLSFATYKFCPTELCYRSYLYHSAVLQTNFFPTKLCYRPLLSNSTGYRPARTTSAVIRTSSVLLSCSKDPLCPTMLWYRPALFHSYVQLTGSVHLSCPMAQISNSVVLQTIFTPLSCAQAQLCPPQLCY